MECQHCRTGNQDSATACASCGKPLMPRTRSATPKRTRRHGRGNRLEATKTKASGQEANSTKSAERIDSSATPPAALGAAHLPVSALAVTPHAAEKEEAERKPMPLVLAPQNRPVLFAPALSSATAEREHKAVARKRSPMLQGLFISAGLIAALVFALSGVGRGNGQDSTTVATAGGLDSQHSVAAAAPQLVNNAQRNKTLAGATSGTVPQELAVAKRAGQARKPVPSPSPSTEKFAKHKTAEHAGKHTVNDSRKKLAENAAKGSTKTLAKFPQPTRSEQDDILLASKTPSTHDKYTQCLELGSFLRREQCKWQVCGGKWGQDGCPSYSSDNRESN